MKIAVLGAGAMGSLYGSKLSACNEVWLVDVWKDHVDTVNEKGLTVTTNDGQATVFHPHATTDASVVGTVELVIVFVKSVNTAAALRQSACLFGEDTMVLTLQNGYGNIEDILPFVREENLFVGTTAAGATMIGPGHVRQAGMGPTNVGVPNPVNLGRAQKIVDLFLESGFPASASDNVMQTIWTKLMVNVGLNAALALLNVRNGFIADCEHALQLAKQLVQEGTAVAAAEGYSISPEEIVQHYYIEGSKVVGHNRCSMLQDVDHLRKTEVERINGAIVDLGKKHGIPTPYNEVLTLLIKAKEDTYHYM